MGVLIPFSKVSVELYDGPSGSVTRKKGSKKLYVSFYYHKVRIVKSTGLKDTPKNELKAREWLDNQMEKIAKGTFVFADAFPGASEKEKAFHAAHEGWMYCPEPQNVLFGDYVETWRKKVLVNYPDNTKDDYNQVIDDRLLPTLGEKTFYQLNGVLLKEFMFGLKWRLGKKEGKMLSSPRIRNIFTPLRAIWDDACEANRWELPDPFKFLRKHIPKQRKKQPTVFRFDEWLRITENIRSYYLPIAEVFVLTGMIGSEMAGFRKQDIMDGHLFVQNSIVRKREKDDLKTTFRYRNMFITQAITKRLEVAAARASGEHVFTMESGRPFDVDSFRKNVWTPALKKAGIEYQVPYATRHTFAAWSLTIGMQPTRLVSLMGHSSKKMVYEVYGNYVEGLEKDADKIRAYFGPDFIDKEYTGLIT